MIGRCLYLVAVVLLTGFYCAVAAILCRELAVSGWVPVVHACSVGWAMAYYGHRYLIEEKGDKE